MDGLMKVWGGYEDRPLRGYTAFKAVTDHILRVIPDMVANFQVWRPLAQVSFLLTGADRATTI
jgi:hypothetical protein